jgi:hypothetical protein
MPHLSLLYSDLSEDRKGPTIDAIGIPLPLRAHFDGQPSLAVDH